MVEIGDQVRTQSCKIWLGGPAYTLYSHVRLCASTRNVFCTRLFQDLKRVFDQHSTQVWPVEHSKIDNHSERVLVNLYMYREGISWNFCIIIIRDCQQIRK